MDQAASVVEYTVTAAHAEELRRRVDRHLVPAARQLHGYRGFLLLDRGEGRRMAILLFDSAADVHAAQEALSPVGAEQTYALMSSPALGSLAHVVIANGVFATAATP